MKYNHKRLAEQENGDVQIKFWGTRGSIAKAGPATVRYGGNTSCVEIRSDSGTLAILDCGTGAHDLGQDLMSRRPKSTRGHLLISHTHWDHIQGLPFFAPLFVPGNEWDIYAPRGLGQSIRETLAGQMQYTYFPITLEAMGATVRYHDLVEGVLEIGDITVTARYLNHPALTLGYRLEANGVTVVYACDHEPHSRHLAGGEGDIGTQDAAHVEFLRGADLVIHDAQYTETEYANKIGWGHSTLKYAAAMCRAAGAKRLALTHHDPMRTDAELDVLLPNLKASAKKSGGFLEIFAAAEGAIIELAEKTTGARKSGQDEVAASTLLTPAELTHRVLIFAKNDASAKKLVNAAIADDLDVTVETKNEIAATIVQGINPSLVILDLSLGSKNALKLCWEIRNAGEDARDVPVIVVANREDIAKGKAAGVTDWLIEPFSPEYARTRIRAWAMRTACRWLKAPLPDDEGRRLNALHALKILDTDADERFDRITRVASALFDVPIAVVSLVDEKRQWFKSCFGLDAKETPRDMAFCAFAILSKGALVVPDTLVDDRFAENPLVTGEPRIRFYAGYPLAMSNGHQIGTMCIIDTRPRDLNGEQLSLLRDMASLVIDEITRHETA